MSTTIDLSQLPAPTVIQPLDYTQQYDEIKAAFLDLMSSVLNTDELAALEATLTLQSEPIVKLLQLSAYREMGLVAYVNDIARSMLLAYATKSDLEHKAAELNIDRLIVTPADPTATPPTDAVYESDDRLRMRVQMALESATVAGPEGSYIFQALSASALVRDVAVTSPVPGTVLVSILSTAPDMQPDADLIAIVQTHLSGKKVRPLSDTPIVASAQIRDYQIRAVLHCYPGPSPEPVLDAALEAVAKYKETTAKIGEDITFSGLYAALHQQGVKRVELIAPVAEIVIGDTEVARCIGVDVSIGDTNV